MNAAELYYSRDPIVEAIIGMATDELPPDRLADLSAIQGPAGKHYKTREQLYKIQLELGAPAPQQQPMGFYFKSADQLERLTVRLDGFSYHRMRPYIGWQRFRAEARRLWELYRVVSGSSDRQILFSEVRYINRLDIPAGEEFGTYLRTFPEIGKELPQVVSGFNLEAVMGLDRLPGELILRQSMRQSDAPNSIAIILDITLKLPVQSSSDEALWTDLLERARVEKNRIFRGCITQVTEARIK